MHDYALAVDATERTAALIRQQQDKLFYVSPFIGDATALLPLVTFKIMVAIHWQALRLWLKGAKIVQRPSLEPREPALVRTGQHPD